MNSLQLTFLGTGTSHGVPVPGCNCEVCLSGDPRNKRTRSSIYVRYGERGFVVDTATEFRLQAIYNGIDRIDAIFFTHEHADHIFGFDDIRGFNQLQGGQIPCYANRSTVESITRIYDYAFEDKHCGGGKPGASMHVLESWQSLHFSDLSIKPLPARHGRLQVYGYLLQEEGTPVLAYITDCSYLPPGTMEMIYGCRLLVIGALRRRSHPTHLNVEEACAVIEKTNVDSAYLTHISHELEHDELVASLPEGVLPAYDGLRIEL